MKLLRGDRVHANVCGRTGLGTVVEQKGDRVYFRWIDSPPDSIPVSSLRSRLVFVPSGIATNLGKCIEDVEAMYELD